jgi:glycosyltransferase involved in cell wall biosynthesis
MKVLIIAPNTKKEVGGWGRYTYEVVEHLKKNGVEVTFDPKDTFDVVHALEMGSTFGIQAFKAVMGTRIPLILSGVGTYSVAPFTKWFKNLIMRIVVHRAAKIVCISDYTRDQIKKYVPHAPVETVLLGLSHMKSNTRKQVSNNPVVLTVGEVKNRKGQLDTFKAVIKLKEKYPNILYVVVGNLSDTYYAQKIKELGHSESIQMYEKINDAELASWYGAAQVFCLNSNNDGFSHFEGFGLVILEAGQFGVPSVGSRGCGIESAIKEGENGYLAEQGNIDDIAEKIEKAILLDKEKVIKFANTFDWNKTVKRYIEIYQDARR